LTAAAGPAVADAMIAAPALEHGFAVVSRNARHFTPMGVSVLDLFP
jgi:predicted nucleic acid-binding protein